MGHAGYLVIRGFAVFLGKGEIIGWVLKFHDSVLQIQNGDKSACLVIKKLFIWSILYFIKSITMKPEYFM